MNSVVALSVSAQDVSERSVWFDSTVLMNTETSSSTDASPASIQCFPVNEDYSSCVTCFQAEVYFLIVRRKQTPNEVRSADGRCEEEDLFGFLCTFMIYIKERNNGSEPSSSADELSVSVCLIGCLGGILTEFQSEFT